MKKNLIVFILLMFVTLMSNVIYADSINSESEEIISLRNQYLKVFKNQDGTTTKRHYANPIHFIGETAQWEEIELSIKSIESPKVKDKFLKDYESVFDEEIKKENYNKAITEHIFRMYFPKKINHSIYFRYNDFKLSMKPLNILSSSL